MAEIRNVTKKEAKKILGKRILAGEITLNQANASMRRHEAHIKAVKVQKQAAKAWKSTVSKNLSVGQDAAKEIKEARKVLIACVNNGQMTLDRAQVMLAQFTDKVNGEAAVKAKLKALETARKNPTEANMMKAAKPTGTFIAKSKAAKPVAVNGPTDPLLHAIAEKADPSDYRTMRIDDDPVTREIASERVQKSAGLGSAPPSHDERDEITRAGRMVIRKCQRDIRLSENPFERETAWNTLDDIRVNGYEGPNTSQVAAFKYGGEGRSRTDIVRSPYVQ